MYWSNCVFKGAVPSSNFVPKFCKFSLALTQVFDDFLFEVGLMFRVDISIADQFVSSNGTVLLSNFIFLIFFFSKKLDKYIDIFVRSLSSRICNKDDVITSSTGTTIAG